MLQNQLTSKISSFIGFILLILVIGCTIFMNIPEQEEEEKKYKSFTQSELADLWQFENVEMKYINTNSSFVGVEKKIIEQYYLDTIGNEHNWSYTSTSNEREIIYTYGNLKILSDIEEKSKLVGFEIAPDEYLEDSIFLSKMGDLFIKYQVKSVSSSASNWNYTFIDLIDNRKIILIKTGSKIFSDYENELIENAEIINDSTRVILPLAIKKIRAIYFNNEKEEKEKGRINLFKF